MQMTIVTGGTGYAEPTGTWAGTMGGDRYPSAAPASASFTFTGLTPGHSYIVGFSYASASYFSSSTPWAITGPATTISGTVDETVAPSSAIGGYTIFALSAVPTSTTLTLTLSTPGTSFTVTSAIVTDSVYASKTGNWSSASTWLKGVVPTASDDVVVSQPCTVTVDVPSTAATVQVNNANITDPSALLQVNSTLALAATSGQALGYAPAYGNAPEVMLSIGAGGLITANPASGQTVTLGFGSGYAYYNAAWQATGTGWGAGQFAEIRNVGAGTLTITTLGRTSNFHGTYVKLTGVNGGIDASTTGNNNNYAGSPGGFLLDHARFSGCGTLTVACNDATIPFRFNDVQFSGSVGSYSAYLSVIAPNAGVERTHDLVSYDIIMMPQTAGMAITNSIFNGGTASPGAGYPAWPTFDSNVIRHPTVVESMLVGGDITNCYVLKDAAGIDNPHFIQQGNATAPWTVGGNIFDAPAASPSGDQGDAIAGGASLHLIADRNLVLPIATGTYAGWACCDLIPMGGSASSTITAEHNTIAGRLEAPAFYYGEGYAGYAGMYLSARSNLMANLSGTVGISALLGVYGNSAAVNDIASASNVTNNGGYGLSTGVGGYGYTTPFTTGTAGAGDVHANPDFVDSTRSFATWAAHMGSTASTLAGRIDDGATYLMADPSLIASSLMPWVRGGFAPTNAAFHNTAHDGTDIGAMAYFSAALPACVGDDCSFPGYFEA